MTGPKFIELFLDVFEIQVQGSVLTRTRGIVYLVVEEFGGDFVVADN